jgi:transposase
MAEFMERKMEEDDEITSAELHRLIARNFSTEISPPTIRRFIRKNLEWEVVRTRFGPMISDTNKVKRRTFAEMCIEKRDTFDDVIWSDESSVQLMRHSQTMRVKVGKERVLKPQAKHALKVHVWAAISKKGATHICVFDQIMDGPLYVKILENFLLPFLSTAFPDGNYRFMQDNDPKHTSRVAKEFYESKDIKWWRTPASSADLNPIERVWRELKYFIARLVKPLNKKELVEGITLFWSQRMTPEKCRAYIDHTFKVLPKIVAKEGGITGE